MSTATAFVKYGWKNETAQICLPVPDAGLDWGRYWGRCSSLVREDPLLICWVWAERH